MCHKASPIPSPVPFLTHLCLGWALTRLQASGLAESIKRKRRVGQHLHFTDTPLGKPVGVALHYTCPIPEVVHWASPRGRPQHWYVKVARAISQKERRRRRPGTYPTMWYKQIL